MKTFLGLRYLIMRNRAALVSYRSPWNALKILSPQMMCRSLLRWMKQVVENKLTKMQIEQDGQTINVFTSEELEAQKQEAVKAATEPIQKELEAAKEALTKTGDKEYNWGQLRQKVDTLEGQIATAEENALKKFEQTQTTNTANSLIKKLADGDEELEKKIHLQFKRLGDEAKTPEEIAKKVRDAWALSRTTDAPDPMTGAFDSGGAAPVMPPKPQAGKPPLSDNQKNFLRMYAGMDDEAIKKYDDAAPPVKFQSPDGNFGKVVI